MADLIAFHTYHSRHSFLSPSTMISRSSDHRRSSSSGTRSPSPDRTITKAKSTDGLSRFISEKTAPAVRSTSIGDFNDSGFSTLRDPRAADPSEESESSSPLSHHPDLNDEVAALSVKLVQAINNQTNLDDSLVATRQELERAQSMNQALRSENEKYRQDIDQEILIKKIDSDLEISRLQNALTEERSLRMVIEKEKKTIEQELETLTAALFEEANKMVAAAKLEREEVEKKNEQLRAQVKDTEALVASQQDQLAELKSVMQDMGPAKDDVEAVSTAPSSPAVPRQNLQGVSRKGTGMTEDSERPAPRLPEELLPGPSTSFQHLIKPICRTDLRAFEDFRELFNMPSSKSSSRAPSGSYPGLNVMSIANLGSGGFGSASSSPSKSQPHSPNGSLSSPHNSSHTPLKETRFYKRSLIEDIEPTLRLDLAPSISWLTRRTVLNGICEGSLLVEPIPPVLDACSMCGERRSGREHERCHRFRTSDNDSAQRYPLCDLCLHRVRSCCGFTGYLRLIRDGHVRAGDVEEEKEVWEETVRLRERMFWSRIGGGIIPLFSQTDGYGMNGTSSCAVHNQVDGPLSLESTGVQTDADYGRDDCYPDYDSDKASVYEDPFVSAGSASPASSVADSAMPDQPEPLDLGKMTEEIYDPSIEQVTISAVHDSKDAEPPTVEVMSREITMPEAEQGVHKDTNGTDCGK